MIKFLQPWLGWWLVGGLAAIVLLKWRVRRRFAAATVSSILRSPAYRSSLFRRLPFAALALALGLIGVGLLEPVLPYARTDVSSQGIDIVVLLDLSSSMQEEIGRTPQQRATSSSARRGKTRLEATKDAIRTFVRFRRDDRMGLVVFSDNPYVVSPLTFDHEYLLRYIDLVDDRILQGEGQTAIGDGLALSNYLLARQTAGGSKAHQAIVLFTDGEYNRGRDPVEVLAESKAADIRVHLVGVDLDQDVKLKPAVQDLIATVEQNGGRYFDAGSQRALLAASRAIDSIEKSTLVSHVYVHDVPVYEWFVVPALVCLAAAVGIRMIPYFVDQT